MNKAIAIVVALAVLAGVGYFVLRTPEPTAPVATAPAATTTTATSTATTGATGTESSATATTTASGTQTTTSATTTTSGASSTTDAAATAETPAPAAGSDTQTAMVQPEQPVVKPEDHVLGSATAPVTIIEYASMTCPHCAAFHAETMPKLKSEFIDKGQVRLVFRPFPLNNLALRASLLAECVTQDKYFGLLDTMFGQQRSWMEAENPIDSLRAMGKDAGIEESKIDACMTDDATTKRILTAYQEAQTVYGVDSTPSFIIGGKKYAGALPFDDLESGGQKVSGLATIIRELLPQ
ncbi:MAG TPA: DsbA family protein [Dongiaceae bacterium]|jgi:protein-disulfide isomerase